MEIEYRMNDIDKLRTDVVQDFLKMVIKPNWKKNLYDKAEEAVNTNHHADNYINAYETMRDKGIESYTIEDMDFSLIATVICYCDKIVKVNSRTRKELEKVRADRNFSRHLNGNEEDEELYLRGLLALSNLRSFVRAVDKYENLIENEIRLDYRTRYVPKIKELMDILDEERIEQIGKEKNIDNDIKKILDCEDEKRRSSLYLDIQDSYFNRDKIEGNLDTLNLFQVKASDAGIAQAHMMAAYYFQYKKDYKEMIRRVKMAFDEDSKKKDYHAYSIIELINCYINHEKEVTPDINEMIETMIKQGLPITKYEDGRLLYKGELPGVPEEYQPRKKKEK